MTEIRPVYCAHCNYLAIMRIDNIPHCRICATKAVRQHSVQKIQKQAKPLRVVRYQDMPMPRQEDLIY